MVKMQVYKVGVDPQKRVPFVLLADDDIERLLPILIGPFEANAIVTQLQGQDFPRPLTHDLLRTIIEEAGYRLERIVVTALENGTFYAVLELEGNGRSLQIDARPSDAIALALRTRSPIFVAEAVLAEAGLSYAQLRDTSDDHEIDRFRELLGDLPDDAELPDTEDAER